MACKRSAVRPRYAPQFSVSHQNNHYEMLWIRNFSDLGLSPQLLKAIEAMGFEQPSPIQAKTIPAIFRRAEYCWIIPKLDRAKPAAFGLPLLESSS